MHLSDRQQQVLKLLSQGKSNKEIAFELGITEGTVKQHLFTLYKKLGVTNRAKAVIVAAAHIGPGRSESAAARRPEAAHYAWRMISTVVIQPKRPPDASANARARFDQQMSALQTEAAGLCDGLDGLLTVIPGGGLLACFGVPHNHLDDPARALFLASRLHAWLQMHSFLQASIGIATAAEVVADNTKVLYRAESIDMAHALALHAQPMQVLASEITCRMAGPVARYSAPRNTDKPVFSHREVLIDEAVDVKTLAAKTPLPFIPEVLANIQEHKAMWVAVEGWPPQSSVRLQDAIAIALQARNINTYRLRLPTEAGPQRTGHCAYAQLNLLARLHQRPGGPTTSPRTAESISRLFLESIQLLALHGPVALIFHGINSHAAVRQLLGEAGMDQLVNSPVILVTSALSDGQDSHIAARLLGARPGALATEKTYRLPMPKPPLAPQGLNADLATLIDTLSPPARNLIRHLVTRNTLLVREAGNLTQELISTGLFIVRDEQIDCRDDSVRESLGGFYVNSTL